MSQRSHIEVGGWGARHYDLAMDLLLMGRYQAFIEQAIKRMDIRRGDAILDVELWAGCGPRNACMEYVQLGQDHDSPHKQRCSRRRTARHDRAFHQPVGFGHVRRQWVRPNVVHVLCGA